MSKMVGSHRPTTKYYSYTRAHSPEMQNLIATETTRINDEIGVRATHHDLAYMAENCDWVGNVRINLNSPETNNRIHIMAICSAGIPKTAI